MKNILFILIIFICPSFLSQLPPPPPEVEISSDKKILVDELFKSTNFENYVYNYCNSIILQYAQQNKWENKKTQQILGNSNFKYFNRVLYDTFKDDSTQDLKNLITTFKKINLLRESDQYLIPNNFEIQKELVLFIIEVVQGKYLLSK